MYISTEQLPVGMIRLRKRATNGLNQTQRHFKYCILSLFINDKDNVHLDILIQICACQILNYRYSSLFMAPGRFKP